MSSIERRVDKLGRIVLPIGYRQRFKLSNDSRVRISLDGNSIIITPSESCCALCGCNENLNKKAHLCSSCIQKIKESY